MKKIIFASMLLFGSQFAQAQLFVEGVPLDSIHHGEFLIIEQSSEVGSKCYLLVEGDKRLDREFFSRGDWMTDAAGKRKPFETRTSAINFLFEQGWEVAFVLTSDKVDDNRLLLRRRAKH